MKNPQFLSKQADILPELPIHELVILTKWHNDRVKIVDFFSKKQFFGQSYFLLPILYICLYEKISEQGIVITTWGFHTIKYELWVKYCMYVVYHSIHVPIYAFELYSNENGHF